jgi:hypothetical protein
VLWFFWTGADGAKGLLSSLTFSSFYYFLCNICFFPSSSLYFSFPFLISLIWVYEYAFLFPLLQKFYLVDLVAAAGAGFESHLCPQIPETKLWENPLTSLKLTFIFIKQSKKIQAT